MDEPSPVPPGRKPWASWIATTLLTFGLMTAIREGVWRAQDVFEQLAMKSLPHLTDVALRIGPYLWIPALVAAAVGLRKLRTREPAVTLAWCLWSVLVFFVVFAVMAVGLYLPILNIQQTLSR